MKCERGGCRHTTNGYDLFDYCARCGRNLCPDHMAMGCCNATPAKSGMDADGDPGTPAKAKEPPR